MAAIVRIKRSGTAGNPATLAAGELAYSSLADTGANGGDRLYIGTGTETTGNAANHEVIGGKYFVGQIDAATNLNTASTIVKRDASGNFVAGTITAALTGTASTATALATGRTIAITGDITYTSPSFNGSGNVTAAGTLATVNSNVGTWNNVTVNGKGLVTAGSTVAYATGSGTASGTNTGDNAVNTLYSSLVTNATHSGDATGSTVLTLATVNANVGTFGSASAVPIITVNAKGLITSVSTAATSSALTIAGGIGTDTVTVGTDTLTFAGGVGVATTVTDNQVSFAIGQAVGTTSNVTFNDLVVSGNLTVSGTTTSINTTTLDVADLNITVAKNAATAAAANGAGLTVAGPTVPATFTYTSADDRWNLNKNLTVTTVFGALSGNATTATALATGRTIAITGDITYTSPSFDGSGNVTAAGTLATVNANVGSFGSGTSVPSFTVNAKGLITAASTTAIPTSTSSVLGLASFNATDFLVTTGAVTIAAVDGGTY